MNSATGEMIPDTVARKAFNARYAMTTWSKDELRKIAETDDLHIAPFREGGATYGHTDVDLVRRGR